MANTHETLVSLFQDTADAIRELTGTTEPLVADQFPEAIRAVGLRRLIANDDTVVATGNLSSGSTIYVDMDFGVLVSYAPNGDVVITMKAGTSTSYEHLRFVLSSAPEGVTMTFVNDTNASGSAGCIYSCVLHGITEPMLLEVVAGSGNSTNDYIPINLAVLPLTGAFTIADVEYTCGFGMTWGEWVASEYNTSGFTFDADGKVCDAAGTLVATKHALLNSYTYYYSDDVIVYGDAYALKT